MAQSVQQLATCWKIRGSNPGQGETFRNYPDWLRGPPSLLYNKYRVFPGGKGGRGVALTTHPHLVPRFTKKSRAIPVFSLRVFAAYNRMEPSHYFIITNINTGSREVSVILDIFLLNLNFLNRSQKNTKFYEYPSSGSRVPCGRT